MKNSIKLLILYLCFFSYEANSKALNFYCKSDFGGESGTAWDVYLKFLNIRNGDNLFTRS